MRNHFSRLRKRQKTWNTNQCKKQKAQQKRKQRKRSFFDGKEKTEKESFAAV